MGGDSFSFWRFDLKSIFKGFLVILILRALSLVLGFDTYLPVIDDALNPIFKLGLEIYKAFANYSVQRLGT